jgi:hypothetical protein
MKMTPNSFLLERQAVVGDEVVVRQGGTRGDDLRAGDDEAGVRLLLDVDADVGVLVSRSGAVDRRMDDRMIQEQHALLRFAVPAAGVLLVRREELCVGPERGEKRRFVVRGSAHESICEPLPAGDGVARDGEPFLRLRRAKEGMGEAAVAGVGLAGEDRRELGIS